MGRVGVISRGGLSQEDAISCLGSYSRLAVRARLLVRSFDHTRSDHLLSLTEIDRYRHSRPAAIGIQIAAGDLLPQLHLAQIEMLNHRYKSNVQPVRQRVVDSVS